VFALEIQSATRTKNRVRRCAQNEIGAPESRIAAKAVLTPRAQRSQKPELGPELHRSQPDNSTRNPRDKHKLRKGCELRYENWRYTGYAAPYDAKF
jgi:hypothetical protein